MKKTDWAWRTSSKEKREAYCLHSVLKQTPSGTP
jgi:hypothetical protein